MLRKVFLIFALIFYVISVTANPKQIVSHGKNFTLSRSIVIVASRSEVKEAEEVAKMLHDIGISARIVRSSVSSKAKIVIERVKNISGAQGTDALQILVSPNIVTIKYTTEESRKNVIEYLRRITVDRVIQGYNITDWKGEVMSVKSGVLDASSRLMPISQMESFIRGEKSREVYIQFVDTNNWRLESEVFSLVNPKEKIYPTNGYYTLSLVSDLIDRMEKNRVKVIPIIDLLSPNSPFEKVTGHKLNSVEGMRFVRAIIEEYANKLGCKTICMGTWTDDADKRYVEFLNGIAKLNGLELIYR